MSALEMDPRMQDFYHSEPCIILRGPNISQPNIHTMVAASGNTSNIDSRYLPETYDNGLMYGMTQFNGIHHQPNLEVGVISSSGLYFPPTINPSSGAGVVPQHINYRASDQLPAPCAYAVSGIFMDDVRYPYKQKMIEGIRGNYPHFNAAASSSVAPSNARHSDGATASVSLPQYRGNHVPPSVEMGPHGSLWSRPDSFMVHEHNHMIQENYFTQHFQPTPPPWLDQQLIGTHSERHNMAWNQSHSTPYVQGKDDSSFFLHLFCYSDVLLVNNL